MVWSEAIEAKVGEVFKAMDKDGSGTVSAKELGKAMRAAQRAQGCGEYEPAGESYRGGHAPSTVEQDAEALALHDKDGVIVLI